MVNVGGCDVTGAAAFKHAGRSRDTTGTLLVTITEQVVAVGVVSPTDGAHHAASAARVAW